MNSARISGAHISNHGGGYVNTICGHNQVGGLVGEMVGIAVEMSRMQRTDGGSGRWEIGRLKSGHRETLYSKV